MKVSLFILILASLPVWAADKDCDTTTPDALKPVIAVAQAAQENEPTCPNRKKLRNLCMMISEQMRDMQDNTKYMYQTRFEQAGCVKETDSAEERNAKIQKAWSMYEGDLKCSNVQFDVANGHLLKFAVATAFDHFLDDVIKWKVDLNRIDPSDGRTVLDYIQFHMNKSKGGALEKKLKNYYDQLRAAGAKHKSEL